MSDWIDIELGDFIELKRGYDLPQKDRTAGNIPIVSSSGKSGLHGDFKVKGPGVITGRYGTIGEVFYSEENFWPLNTTLYVKDFKGNDPLFTYYFLKTVRFSDYSDKAAVPGINRNHLHKAIVKVPSDPIYQRQLALKLWELDKKIHLNTQTNQTLESIAQAIFKSWFVDFEPVKAKMAALESLTPALSQREREQKVLLAAMGAISGKSEAELTQLQQQNPEHYQQLAETAALFPSAMVESELGEIPEGWEVKAAADIFTITIGKTPPRKEPEWFTENNKDISWLSIRDMGGEGIFSGKTSEYLTREAITKFNVKVTPPDTVFLSFKLTVGRVSIASREMATNEAIAHFLPSKKASHFWTYLYLKSFDYNSLGSTSSIATAVNSKTIKDLQFLLPDGLLMNTFHRQISNIFNVIRNNENQTERLSELRDSLLPKLLSGEIDLTHLQSEVA